MKVGQWFVVVKHDKDPSLIGRVVVVASPLYWRDYNEKMVDVQIDDKSCTFIHEDGLRPLTMTKEVRKELRILFDLATGNDNDR
jgi:hypothetical protein